MIAKLVAPLLKLLLPKITQKVTDHLAKIFKLDSVLRYMELPNDADRGVKSLQNEVEMIKGELKEVIKESHPAAIDIKEWEEVKSVVKKIQKLRAFKSLGK